MQLFLEKLSFSLVFSAAAYCVPIWCCSVHIFIIDMVNYDPLHLVIGYLRPRPSASIQARVSCPGALSTEFIAPICASCKAVPQDHQESNGRLYLKYKISQKCLQTVLLHPSCQSLPTGIGSAKTSWMSLNHLRTNVG